MKMKMVIVGAIATTTLLAEMVIAHGERGEKMRLTDADALADRLDALAYDDWNQGASVSWADAFKVFAEMVRDEIAVDAEPVRRGHWELSPFDGNWTCSKCGNKPYHSNMRNMNYCPNCGCKMDEAGRC